ncbi:MAG: hypothetical protein JSS26_19960 [Nitrospira sp.]|nr:hypothetical protein [Nitrospira sp.]
MSNVTPKHALLFGIAAAALATVGMPYISGYGTVLAQAVGLGAWGILASASSGAFADQHHQILWPIAGVLNVVLFSLVTVPVYFVLRRRAPSSFVLFVVFWALFYVGCLFFLFPATDGP